MDPAHQSSSGASLDPRKARRVPGIRAGVYILQVGLFFSPAGIDQGLFFPYFISSLTTFDTFYGVNMGQHAYKTLTMPKNHRFMLKIARKTPNFAIFHLFWVYFFPPQTGPRPIFFPPPCRTYFEVYTSPDQGEET